MYDDEEVISKQFAECTSGHPDDHNRLEGRCQHESHFYYTVENDIEHTDSNHPNYHNYISPDRELVWGENASRVNDCPENEFEQSEENPWTGRLIAVCNCPCHWNNYYVNVYEVHKSYGGPEEGGWHYNVGEPYESIRVNNYREAQELESRLWDKYTEINDNRTNFDFRFEVWVEKHFAKFWPETRPHYE